MSSYSNRHQKSPSGRTDRQPFLVEEIGAFVTWAFMREILLRQPSFIET